MAKHIQADCFNPEYCDGTCYGCTVAVCSVCWGLEGSLTIDCPGVGVSFDEGEKVYTGSLEYTDTLGWHQREGEKTWAANFKKE